jgi:hypothetical protein
LKDVKKFRSVMRTLQQAYPKSRLIELAVSTAGRTFFDPASSEWASTSLKEKIAFVKILDEHSLRDEMIEGYKLLHQDRPDIVEDVRMAFRFFESFEREQNEKT